MLKLTSIYKKETVRISCRHIVVITDDPGADGALINTVNGEYRVIETDEEIMAMPEMVKHLNPMYAVQKDQFKYAELRNGNIVVLHPDIPAHIWDGEKMERIDPGMIIETSD